MPRPHRRPYLNRLRASAAATGTTLALVLSLAADAPVRLVAGAAPSQAPPPSQQRPAADAGVQPPPGLDAQPLPPEVVRKANLELEAALKKEAALIEGARVGPNGEQVGWAVEGGLLLTRDLWVAMLRHRAAGLRTLRDMSREEKIALVEKLLKAAPAVHDAYVNMVAAEGPARDALRNERALYEDQLRGAEDDERAATNTALTEDQRKGLLARAAERRQRAERNPWKFYADRQATFFGLLEASPENVLLGLYQDNWVMPNRYLFQTLMHTNFSWDSVERGNELVETFDDYLDVTIARYERLATQAEEIDEFDELIEFLQPRYARIHDLVRAITATTGMTFPALSVGPFADIQRSFDLDEAADDMRFQIFITIVSLGTMPFPILGAMVNSGIAVVELVVEGGGYVVQWSMENDARLLAAVTGQQHVITEQDRTRAQGGRAVFAVIQAATELPFVRGTVREGLAARRLRARMAARFGPDIDLSTTPAVQRGARRARELGIPQATIDDTLRRARTIDYETAVQRVRARGIEDTSDEFANAVEAELASSWSAARPYAAALVQIDKLDEIAAAALAAGVPGTDIKAMFAAAQKAGRIGTLAYDLPQQLLRATLSRRNVTLVIDRRYPRRVETPQGFQLVEDFPGHNYLQFWTNVSPPPVIREDLQMLLTIRERLSIIGRGGVTTWSNAEMDLLRRILKHDNVQGLFVHVSDENVFVRLFEDDQLLAARNFLTHPNHAAIANGEAVMPLTRRLTIGEPPPLGPAVDPFSRYMLTGAAATNALLRMALMAQGSEAANSGPYSPSTGGFTGTTSAIPTPAVRGRIITGTPTAGDLEDWAVDRATSRFGNVTGWQTTLLPDGRVAVTSPDIMRRVTVEAVPIDGGDTRIDFTIEERRDRFIDHDVMRDDTRLQFPLTMGGSTLMTLGVPSRPVREHAPETGTPAAGTSAPATRVSGTPAPGAPAQSGTALPQGTGGTTATPQQSSAVPLPQRADPSQSFFAHASPGTTTNVGGENVWTPVGAVTTAGPNVMGGATGGTPPPATATPPALNPPARPTAPPGSATMITPPASPSASAPPGPIPTPVTPGSSTNDPKSITYGSPSSAGYGWRRSEERTWTLNVGARFDSRTGNAPGRPASPEADDGLLAGLYLISGGLMTEEQRTELFRRDPAFKAKFDGVFEAFAAAVQVASLVGSARPDDTPQHQATLAWTDDQPIVVAANEPQVPALPWVRGGLWALLRDALGRTRVAGPYASRAFGPRERWLGPAEPAQPPAGSQAQAERPSAKLFFTSLGRSSGESVRMTVVNDGTVPVRIALGAVALEPLEKLTDRDVQRELKKLAGKPQVTVNVEAYCLNFRKPPPAAGMVMRLAGASQQANVAPLARISEAVRRLYQRGALNRESDPKRYVQSLLQWVIWTQEQRFDEPGFRRAFVEHAQKNIAGAGRQWTRELEQAVTALTPQRWTDIQAILREADTLKR